MPAEPGLTGAKGLPELVQTGAIGPAVLVQPGTIGQAELVVDLPNLRESHDLKNGPVWWGQQLLEHQMGVCGGNYHH